MYIEYNFRVSLGKNQKYDYNLMRIENDKWDRIEFSDTIWTKYIRLEVLEIEKILFGGLKEIRLFGCGPSMKEDNFAQTTRRPDWFTTPYNYGDYNEEVLLPKYTLLYSP